MENDVLLGQELLILLVLKPVSQHVATFASLCIRFTVQEIQYTGFLKCYDGCVCKATQPEFRSTPVNIGSR
ncbi:Testis-expressed protein [Trichinella spiralis]|uniref:Testis-expressed protein n=1 Tax=Trichinella spiralis TaxID=6334 RepID=A0ABR3K646_TRISP